MPDLDEDNDEITIDFSKISGFLKNLISNDDKEPKAKKEKKPKKRSVSTEDDEDEDAEDDEITIDFSAIGSKLKGLFKGKGKDETPGDEGDGEELSIDFKAVFSALTKYKHWLIPIVLIFIALFLSTNLRMQSASLPIADGWGRDQIYNVIQNDISTVVYAQNPTLPREHQSRIVADQLNKAIKESVYTFRTGQYAGQTFDIAQQAKATSQQLKGHLKDDDGITYLLAIDPWTHFRKVRNKIETGEFYDELRDGVGWNTHMIAPLGREMWIDLHPYIGYYTYKILSIFQPGTTPMGAFFLVPVLVSALAVIPVFFITKRIGGNLGGFIAAVIIAVHPLFLGRTAGGFADTDAYSVTLPLFVAWAFLEAFEAKDLRKKVSLAAIAGFFVGFTSFAWIGWWYIFDFLLATVGLFMVSEVVRSFISKNGLNTKDIFKRLKHPLILLITFFLVSGLFVSMFTEASRFQWFYERPFGFTQRKEVALTTIWPNVYTTVAEQNPASLSTVRSSISFNRHIFFYLSIIGILLTMVGRGKRKFDIKYALFLTIWFIGTSYASLKGVRFIMLLVPAFSIALGVFAGLTSKLAAGWLARQFHFNKNIAQGALAVLLVLLLLILPIQSGMSTARQQIPSMNDDWHSALTKIKTESAQDAIINSWWDFGHWFKAIADRRVTFDGASQNTPMAHWIGRVLLTENEDEAIGILRMLDCGSTLAFDRLNSSLGGQVSDQANAVEILYDVVILNREGARSRLEEVVSPAQAEEVLQYTHCDPPEDYFITSGDMVSKSGVWSHFGSWDLRRAAMYHLVRPKNMQEGTSLLKEDFGLSENEATRIYYEVQTENGNDWIAPWPSYWASGPCTSEGDIVTCQSSQMGGSFTLDRTTGETAVPTQQGKKRFSSVAFVDSEQNFKVVKSEENVLENAGVRFGAVVYGFPQPDQFILTSARIDGPQQGNDWLPGSMFSRLFFFKGYDLEHFELFDSKTGNSRIFTWKVDWDGNLKSNVRPGNKLWLNYVGWGERGEIFDSNIIDWQNLSGSISMTGFEDYETNLLPYVYGSGTMIPGFEQALEGMMEGEIKDVEIPPELAYGTDPALHPLANQTLHFRIQVVKIA